MNILILTLGTRGDVQPFVALGQGLKAAGHAVTLCTSSNYESFIIDHGLEYGYMNDDIMKLIDSDEGRKLMENTTGMWGWIKAARRLAKQAGPMNRRMLKDSWESVRKTGPDLIIGHPKAFGAPHFAEALGVPFILALPMPLWLSTAEFPAIGFPNWRLGGWYNRLTHSLFQRLTAVSFGKHIREWRAEHDEHELPPLRSGIDLPHTTAGEPIPILHAYSRHVIPKPAEWPDGAVTTGYWFLDQPTPWQPPAGLQQFLDAGDPPVYVGFGSMAGRNPQRLTQIIAEALQRARARGIIATGWGGLGEGGLPETVFKIDQAPHDWLFPRMAAVVHHGGAGTTAAGLRAGRPTVICPFIGDQPFWAWRVHALGVGSKPIPQRKLTVAKLAGAIREVMTNQTIRQNAESLGERIRREDGIANAVAVIERIGESVSRNR